MGLAAILRRKTHGLTAQTRGLAGCVPHRLPLVAHAGLKGNERGRAWFSMPATAGMLEKQRKNRS
jgi:hypothetical protein